MKDVKEEFIPYRMAKALKKLGFDEPCFGFYYKAVKRTTGRPVIELAIQYTGKQDHFDGQDCSAPLRQQAFRWFRKDHSLVATPLYIGGDWKKYDIIMHDDATGVEIEEDQMIISSYGDAEIACLETMLNLVKRRIKNNKQSIIT
jgi:hypothetical protein